MQSRKRLGHLELSSDEEHEVIDLDAEAEAEDGEAAERATPILSDRGYNEEEDSWHPPSKRARHTDPGPQTNKSRHARHPHSDRIQVRDTHRDTVDSAQ